MNREEKRKAFTYKVLLGHLQTLNKEQLNSNVSICSDMDFEYYPAFGFRITEEDDVLDKNHPIIEID